MVGDTISVTGLTFKQPPKDLGQYLLKEGIMATVFMTKLDYTILERPQRSFARWLFYTRENLINALEKKLSPRTFQLFASIFLGNKQSPKWLIEKTKEHFNTWGVTHYLARSGLHMVIFVFIWQLLLRFLPAHWIAKELILLIASFLYCTLSWASVSFNRAFLTFLFHKACMLFSLQTNFLHLLTLVCLTILLHNPMQLFFLDFQLSFGLTCALAVFTQLQLHHKHRGHKTVAS